MSDTFWKNKRVLVTGVTGFVGGAIAKYLHTNYAFVVGLIHDFPGGGEPPEYIDSVDSIVIGDVTNYNLMRQTIAKYEIDFVFHLAASAIVRISAQDPMTAYHTNVMGTVALLEAVRNVRPQANVIVASSDKAYGHHDLLPYTEDHALQPLNTYDTSKACMDMISRSYAHNYDMNVVVTRCSNIYGPGDKNISRIIPNTILRAKRGESPILYKDIENMQREFIYISDVVNAYCMLAEDLSYIRNAVSGKAFNIGGNGPSKMRDVVEMLLDILGKKDLEIKIIDRNNLFKEIDEQYIDAKKLRELTAWRPFISLREGLEMTVPFYSDRA